MNEVIAEISLILNLIIIAFIGYAVWKKNSEKKNIEVKYFEYIEDIESILQNSKRVTIKGQIFIDGVPAGGQYIVAEKSFKKFDYDKLTEFKKEIIEPFATISIESAKLYLDGIPTNFTKDLSSKLFRSKSR